MSRVSDLEVLDSVVKRGEYDDSQQQRHEWRSRAEEQTPSRNWMNYAQLPAMRPMKNPKAIEIFE